MELVPVVGPAPQKRSDTKAAAGDERYIRYVVARFGAYRNVWWSLANEYDFLLDTKPISQWDASGLLILMWETWNDVFRLTLGFAERSLVSEIVEMASFQATDHALEIEGRCARCA